MVFTRFAQWLLGPETLGATSSSTPSGTSSTVPGDNARHRNGQFNPTIADVLVAKAMLAAHTKLPLEVVNMIIERAEYWVVDGVGLVCDKMPGGSMRIHGDTSNADRFLIRSKPLGLSRLPLDYTGRPFQNSGAYSILPIAPAVLQNEPDLTRLQQLAGITTPLLEHPCRKIVFKFRSHDQGYGGHYGHRHTHEGSWTWFSAGKEQFDLPDDATQLEFGQLKPLWPPSKVRDDNLPGRVYDHPLLPEEERMIQNNLVAKREWQDYEVTWSYLDGIEKESEEGRAIRAEGRGQGTADGEFVRSLKLGDVITVWGHARFPQWVNSIYRVRMEVYWMV